MHEVEFLVAVTGRGQGEALAGELLEAGALYLMDSAGRGTATSETLRLLGLGDVEKDVLFAIVPLGRAGALAGLAAAKRRAVAFSVAMNHFRADAARGERDRVGTEGYEVVVAIANRGYIDAVMDAARAAGATGGTVIHARGAGSRGTEKFFGVSVAAEKEVYYIVARAPAARAIAAAIERAAGPGTRAQAKLFLLPVSHAAGFEG